MKATNNITNYILKSLILLISVFLIRINTASAGGYNFTPSASFSLYNLISVLSPLTPKEADFEDVFSTRIENFVTSVLNPAVPSEAGFDESPETIDNIAGLAPVNPSEADFTDNELSNGNIKDLAPLTPSEADFNN